MPDDDFFDFMIFDELMFPDDPDKTVECPACGRKIKGGEIVTWVDKAGKTFKCPDCDERIEIE